MMRRDVVPPMTRRELVDLAQRMGRPVAVVGRDGCPVIVRTLTDLDRLEDH